VSRPREARNDPYRRSASTVAGSLILHTPRVLHESGGEAERPELQAGVRVRVIKDPEWGGPWPGEPLGVIESALQGQLFLTSQTQWGPVREYKVRFDSPQYDSQGQGPYVSAVIWQQYIVLAH
jgi:hypothetical protein